MVFLENTNFKSHGFIAVVALAHSKINQIVYFFNEIIREVSDKNCGMLKISKTSSKSTFMQFSKVVQSVCSCFSVSTDEWCHLFSLFTGLNKKIRQFLTLSSINYAIWLIFEWARAKTARKSWYLLQRTYWVTLDILHLAHLELGIWNWGWYLLHRMSSAGAS